MLMIIGPAIIVLVVVFGISVFKEYNGFWASLGFGMGGAVAAALVGLILGIGVGAALGTHPEPVHNYQLLNIRDASGLSGSFFLGSGTIDEEPVFYYYARRDDGSIFLDHVFADYATIYETSEQPHIEITEEFSNHPKIAFSPDAGLKGANIYIPPNSVVTNFSLGGTNVG